MESWEFQNNTSDLMLFLTDYFDETPVLDPTTGESKAAWLYDYEARFPDDTWSNYAKLQELQSFIVSCDRNKATGGPLPSPVTYSELVGDETKYTTYDRDTAAYRLRRFREEFGDYAEVDSFIFYYIFTELFLMVDSRAKNLFIGFSGGTASGLTAIDRKAVAEPYDMDTALGINNEGSLAFDYSLEDTDQTEGGADVFNGQNSVLWCNVRDAFPSEIVQMYQTLRSSGTFSYATVEGRFEDHQARWPEAVFNEDAWFKYIVPLTSPDPGKAPTAVYLPMLQGSKAEQRKWWLYNRFRYMDSKWNAGDALVDVIQVRGYAKDNITVTPYADIYPTVKYGSYLVSERGHRGVPTTLVCPLSNVNDTEIYIYSAPQIASVGDLSGLKVGFADFSKASRLQSIKVGDGTSGYTNGNLTELLIGNNRLLESVDARNCTALTGSIDLSGASNIRTVLMQGTAIASVNLPVGGMLQTLRLPATIANLTIRDHGEITLFTVEGGSYDTITTLRIENCGDAIPIFDILEDMANGSRVRLIGMSTSISTIEDVMELYDRFDLMGGLDEGGNNVSGAVVSGTITGVDVARRVQLNRLAERYPNITIECALVKEGSIVRFYNGDTLLQYIDNAPNGQTAEYTGPTPVHPTAPETHEFVWWYPTNEEIQDETDCYAQFHDTASITVKYLEDRIVDLDTLDVGVIRPYAFNRSRTIETVVTEATRVGEYAFANMTSHDVSFTFSNETELGTHAMYYTHIGSISAPNGLFLNVNSLGYVRSDSLSLKVNGFDSGQYYAGPLQYANIGTLSLELTTSQSADFSILKYANVDTVRVRLSGSAADGGVIRRRFDSCRATHIIIDGEYEFNDTTGYGTTGTSVCGMFHAFYVPSSMLETYRAYDFFKGGRDPSIGYANKATRHHVFSIDQYPVEEPFVVVQDSWSDIATAARNGTYESKYQLGDIKRLDLSDGTYLYMQLVAFDADVPADDPTSTVPMTWLACWSSRGMRSFSASSSTDLGWENSAIRAYLSETVFQLLPAEVRTAIRTVTKHSRSLVGGSLVSDVQTSDALWMPSAREVGFTGSSIETLGPTYGTSSRSYGYSTDGYNSYYVNTRSVSNWSLDGRYGYLYEYNGPGLTSGSQSPSSSNHYHFGFCI